MPEKRVVIVGAGLGGSLLASLLGAEGYSVDVYEMRGDPRTTAVPQGRSINLAISTRGLTALGRTGLDRSILDSAVPMRGRMIHSAAGTTAFQPYDRAGQAINSVSRGELNLHLIEAADSYKSVTFQFRHKLVDLDLDDRSMRFDSDGGETLDRGAVAVIGADGAFSAVRRPMLRRDRFSYSLQYLEHGYKELNIPAGPDGTFLIEKNALHIWPRGEYMMIALPNHNGSFTCTLFWPFSGPNGLDTERSPAEIAQYFETHFADAVALMPTFVEDYISNPTSSLATFRCWPWHVGRTVLVGDAAHAVVPFYGQGANASFEDCTALLDCLNEQGGDWDAAISRYGNLRKRNADAIADLALANFVEMRDSVGEGAFRLKKRLEKIIQGAVPFWYTPLYTMISFSNIPYADAVDKSAHQDRWFGRIMLFVTAVVVALVVWLLT